MLHPSAIVQLAGMLRPASRESQVLLATQSVTLMNQFELGDLVLVERRDGASVFERPDPDRISELAVILNLTPVPRRLYRLGLPRPGQWREVLNSDAAVYGGSNMGNLGGVMAEDIDSHNQSYSAVFTLPPLSIIAFKSEAR